MTELEQLTKKIQRHCPELLELSFGCVLRIKYNEYKGIVTVLGTERDYVCFYIPGSDYVYYELADETGWEIKEILGHPITQIHLMKALGEANAGCLIDVMTRENGFFRMTFPNLGDRVLYWQVGHSFEEFVKELTQGDIDWLNKWLTPSSHEQDT